MKADEQIKPLTEEEKKAKLAELREKLAAKRAAQGKEDEKAARANEAIRRKAGQDMGRAREDMAVKEAQRDAERKRQGEYARGASGSRQLSFHFTAETGLLAVLSASPALRDTATVAL